MTRTPTQTPTFRPSPIWLAALVLTGFGASAQAQGQDQPYYYGGLSLGSSRALLDEGAIAESQRLSGGNAVTITGISEDTRDTSYRVFLGYQFNRNIGLEASFFQLGRFHLQADTLPTGTLNGELKMQGGGLDVVGAMPLGEQLSFLARVGGQYAKTVGVFSGSGAFVVNNPSPSHRELNYKVGVGLQYAFSANFLMRAEAEQYRVNDAMGNHGRVQVASISLVMPFGEGAGMRRTARAMPMSYAPPAAGPAPTPAPMPEPVVVAAAPMVVPAPPPAMPKRVSFSADALFDFDKASLRTEGKSALDAFARDMAGTQFDLIVVEGHADRTGSAAYNQKLSLQRADTVKAWLVSSGGFDATRISTAGMGERAPTTQPADCKASLPTTELRACLQPDRRVDVDVSGTR
ncbi:OmpA family protein [Ideonella margarita]|uniref:OmpA family protein n=1 Tax=Ideonella margarita TaxID=2984191 RepID=A0ABU9C798_9BURK